MRKSSAVLGSLFFLVLAPGTVAGLVPWWISGYRLPHLSLAAWLAGAAGALLIVGGLVVMLGSFARFVLEGLGTPAPVAPPQHLVVGGWYRYVRNPMYAAGLALILGQALLFENVALLAYAAIVCICFTAFVMAYEEPALRRQFGQDYLDYCARVPRWIPWARKS